QLLQRTRHVDGPGPVAVVAPDLADDGRRGIRHELDVALRVEAVERLEEPDPADLGEVVEGLSALRIPGGERAHEPLVALDELVPRAHVRVALPALDEDVVGAGACSWTGRRNQGGEVLPVPFEIHASPATRRRFAVARPTSWVPRTVPGDTASCAP